MHYTYTQISKRQEIKILHSATHPRDCTTQQPCEEAILNATTCTYILLYLEHLEQLMMNPETRNFKVQ